MASETHFSASGYYRIEAQGRLQQAWAGRFGAMQMLQTPKTGSAVTILQGRVSDQAELLGILQTLHELHLPLLAVQYLGAEPPATD